MLVAGALLFWAYRTFQGDVEALFYVRLVPGPGSWQGYDGQFVYVIARDWYPERVQAYLDRPAYRYQRILLPALARGLSGGKPQGILFAVWGLGLFVHLAATGQWASWLARRKQSPWWSLLYGLWPGLLLGLRVGLPEPLTYGLAFMGFLWSLEGRWMRAGFAFLAAVFAKELAWAFLLAGVWALFQRRRPREALGVLLGIGALWAAWQGWLWFVFGRPGLAVGGGGATPVPVWPLGGLAQVVLSLPPTWVLVYLLVFGPSLIFPLLLGVWWVGVRMRQGLWDAWTVLLAFHSGLGLWLPMSSWEPFAAFRVLTGFMVAFWGIALEERRFSLLRRLIPFWLALLAFVVAR